MDALGRVLVVVYTWRGDEIRLYIKQQREPLEATLRRVLREELVGEASPLGESRGQIE